jgi:hypothetical protein
VALAIHVASLCFSIAEAADYAIMPVV